MYSRAHEPCRGKYKDWKNEKMHYNKGLVSCTTPVYNREQYLGKMLESILNQTYPFIEMILVDDGSTDSTLEITESYKEDFAERGFGYQIIHTPHKNASAAINQGIKYLTGEFLIWPDSDDVLEPKSVEVRVNFLTKNSIYSVFVLSCIILMIREKSVKSANAWGI